MARPDLSHGLEPTQLAEEQAALRRVAALVARGAAPEEVFAAVVEEIGRLLPVEYAGMGRYEPDGSVTYLAAWGTALEGVADGSQLTVGEKNLAIIVFETGRPARIDTHADPSRSPSGTAREVGARSAVATPILVDGRLWGVMGAGSTLEQPLPAETEVRLASFTELLATTIANAESRAGVTRLSADQAALRRVATLVARAVPPEEVFAAVVEEVGRLLPVDFADLGRCEPDGTITFVAGWGKTRAVFPVGARLKLGGKNATTLVAQSGRPVRVESYADASGPIGAPTSETGVRSAIGTPVTVDGQLWGVMAAGWSLEEPMPADTEPRLAQFTDLLETAIANAEARAEVTRLAQEQAALRRVATLVAREASQAAVFTAIAEEIGQLLGTDEIRMLRYGEDGSSVVLAGWGEADHVFPVGSRVPLGGDNASSRVFRTGETVRIDDYENASGPAAQPMRAIGIRAVVAAPVLVDGRLWGAIVTGTTQNEPLPTETESRLSQFTELMATAIANTESHARADGLAEEQAALRRVATLVAKEAPAAEVFAKVAEELANVLGDVECSLFRDEGDGTASAVALSGAGLSAAIAVGTRLPLDGNGVIPSVLREGRPCRIGDYFAATGAIAQRAREAGLRSAVGCPLVVGEHVWGAMSAARYVTEAFPPETEARMAQFADLVATAIANAEARTEVERLVDEQAALRRVATLVAREASEGDVFAIVTKEAARVLRTEAVGLLRFERDGAATLVAQSHTPWDPPPLGTRFPLDGENLVVSLHRTGQATRVDDWSNASGAVAGMADMLGVRSSVATPIAVEGRLWGTIIATTSQSEPLPAETETRLGRFSDLVATAIANAAARTEVERLLDEQAALRRVATLVAEDMAPSELFAAVTEEVGKLLDGDLSGMIRYNDDGTVSPVAAWAAAGELSPLPSSWPTQEGDPATMVAQAGRPIRVDNWAAVPGPIAAFIRELGVQSSVGGPISVEGRLWGALAVHSQSDQPLPASTESRLVSFTELVATAMANAEARGEVERLAQEQAALRRVATLVAEGAKPAAVFDAVAAEMEALLGADQVALNRFEPSNEILVLAHRGLDVTRTPVGSRVSIEGQSVTATVRRTARPARMENYEAAAGPLAELARGTGLHSSVAAPIVVEGGLWGLITASWKGEQSPVPDTEQRMSRFAQLLDAAIANAEARAELVASRARLVAASDEARRRFERDLHDGVQQRLVSVALELRSAEAIAQSDSEELAEQLTHVGKGLADALDGLRELSRGIHPAILSEAGLVPALKTLARRSAVPVQLDLAIAERFAEHVEIGAYYVVSEALTNAAKHARASKVEVHARALDGMLELKIDDDGVGGADPSRGSGLTGLADRVEALGGAIWIASPPGEGTSLRVALSLDTR